MPDINYRKKNHYDIITFPQDLTEEDRLKCKKPCCKGFLALASSSSTDDWKNDHFGFALKRSNISDIVTFTIEKCGTGVVPNLGLTPTFPEDPLAIGFVWDWRQHLIANGIGKYKVSVSFTISGVSNSFDIATFELKEYSIDAARGTVRLKTKFNSKYQKLNIDFTNSDYFDTIRLNGFFGNREPNTEINELITKGRVSEKVTRENLNEYTLRTDPIGIGYTRRLIGDARGSISTVHLLAGDSIEITDHNASNHDYFIQNLQVVPMDEPDIEYIDRSRHAKMTVKFGDRKKLDKSYYNQKA